EIHEVEGYYIQSFIVLMLLKISFSEKDGKINRLNAADILNVVRNDCHISLKDVSDKSISRWVNDSLIEEGQLSLAVEDGRLSTVKDNVIYLLIKYGHANRTSKELANLLSKEGDGYQLQQSITSSQLVNYIDALVLKYASLHFK
ncbi:hypothetical protein ACO1ZG_24150, partial [Enterobacter kobei]